MQSGYLAAIAGKRCSLDANILVYSFDNRAGEKQQQAKSLIKALCSENAILTLQALGECYWAVSRKGIAPRNGLVSALNDLQHIFPLVAAAPNCFGPALDLKERYLLPFWHAMLLATLMDSGVQVLFTEDLQHGQTIGGVRIVNPFSPTV